MISSRYNKRPSEIAGIGGVQGLLLDLFIAKVGIDKEAKALEDKKTVADEIREKRSKYNWEGIV